MTACRWCEGALPPSRSQAKLFCSDRCRGDYHDGCRRFTEAMIADGAVSVETVRALASRRARNGAEDAVNGSAGAGEGAAA